MSEGQMSARERLAKDAEWKRFRRELVWLWLTFSSMAIAATPFIWKDIPIPVLWWLMTVVLPGKPATIIAIYRSKLRMWRDDLP